MSKPRDDRQKNLLRPPLDEIIDLRHPLARLGRKVDWDFLDRRFSVVCRAGPGQPPLPTRLVAGLLILKHMHDLSDEALCARWLENPYYQYFCGEESFCHILPFERSALTRWRQRLGEEQLAALLAESLSVAHKTGALATKNLERFAVDTTVQPKNVAFPTDARLMHRAIVGLGRAAKKHGVPLRQSYVRVAKRAALMAGHYSHAKQFKRYNSELKFLRTRLGRLVRDIRGKTEGDAELTETFAIPLARADQVRHQKQRRAAGSSTSYTPPRWNASAREKRGRPMNSAARSASQPRSQNPRAASSCCTPRHCTATLTTATRWGRSSPGCKSSPASRRAASMSIKATASTTTRTNSGSESPARCAASPRRSAAK